MRVFRSWRPVALLVAVVTLTGLAVAPAAVADDTTVSYDNLRTGWDPNEPNLNNSTVKQSDFGQLFGTQLDGQIYAQPIVAGGMLLVATENDQIYGLDPITGTIQWQRDVGPAWPAAAIGCGDLTPNIGITSTPVYDSSSGTAYFTAKVNNGVDDQHPHWYLHAVDVATGAERANFPVLISGTPSNSPGHPFNPFTAMQRPGLLLLDGHIYAGFASHCDDGPYVGYVFGWDAATGARTALWSTEAGSSDGEAGIWQSGGGLVSDGSGRIFVATGNGVSPAPGPGDQPPGQLAESVVRLAVGNGGGLSAGDFFSPVNNTNLDRDDTDLGSGGPLAIPDGYGTTAHPQLLVEVGKDGRVFLLDRDDLGGTGQGPGGTDGALQVAGPYNGVWGHPAFWGGDTGYVYDIENGGPLRAFSLGVTGGGLPSLTSVGQSSASWGYTSGSPVVTSDGTTAGSALVWAVYSSGPDGTGGQLRAYSATPNGSGTLALEYSAPIGHVSKFEVPATDAGRVYVGSRTGMVFGFGRPVQAALTGTSTEFGSVTVHHEKTGTATLTAARAVTIQAISATVPFGTTPPSLPVDLGAGDTLAVPVSFAPTAPGDQSGELDVTTNAGDFVFGLHGTATRSGIEAVPHSLDFGQVPVTGSVTLGVNVTNTSRVSETVTGATAPTGSFSTTGLPAVGSTIAAGSSVAVEVTFRPRKQGDLAGAFRVTTNTGAVRVPLTGTGVAGAPQLSITPTNLAFGTIPVGTSKTKKFVVQNTGNLVLTITKAAPPAAPFAADPPIAEGQQLDPGQSITQRITFSPTATGKVAGEYLITGNDGQGEQTVGLTGQGSPPLVTVPGPASGTWQDNGSAQQNGDDTQLTDDGGSEAGSAVSPTAYPTADLTATFNAQIDGGSGADGMTFALLDASASTPSSLGDSGGALGFDGLTGVAVTLDTYQNSGDPNANFMGIAVSDGTHNAQVQYSATRRVATSLRSGTHTVTVTVRKTSITATIDGQQSVTATVPVPAHAYLAFTGGTGGLTDYHVVSGVSIKAPPS